jgi:hypothetical protein
MFNLLQTLILLFFAFQKSGVILQSSKYISQFAISYILEQHLILTLPPINSWVKQTLQESYRCHWKLESHLDLRSSFVQVNTVNNCYSSTELPFLHFSVIFDVSLWCKFSIYMWPYTYSCSFSHQPHCISGSLFPGIKQPEHAAYQYF